METITKGTYMYMLCENHYSQQAIDFKSFVKTRGPIVSETVITRWRGSSSSCLHDRATVRSGAGTPQVPWQVSGVVQKLAYWVLGSVFPRVRH